MRLKERFKAVAIALIFLSAMALLWRRVIPEPDIEQVARIVEKCIDEGNAGCVRRWMLEQELEQSSVDVSDLKVLLDELNRAKHGWTAGELEFWTQRSLGSTNLSRKYRNGPYTGYLSFMVVMTSDGPRAQLVHTLIGLRYYLERPVVIPGKSKGSQSLVSLLIGLQREQSKLERMGIKGMPSLRPGEPLTPWLEFRRKKYAALERVGIKPADYGLARP